MAELPLPAGVLALVAAAGFGGGQALVQRGLRHAEPLAAGAVAIGVTAACFWGLLLLRPEAARWSWGGVALFAAVGLLQPLLTILFTFEGTRRLGSTLAASVGSTAPLFSALVAVALLGERVTPPVALGTACVIGGVMALSHRGAAPRRWPLAALLLPIGTAASRGLATPLAKVALAALPDPLLGAAVTYSVGFAGALGLHGMRLGRLRPRMAWPAPAIFLVVGLGNALAFSALLLALGKGEVVVVAPLLSSGPLFTMLVSVGLLRQEPFTPRILAGVLLVVGGVMAVAATG
ncbi:MAG: DMT family transporter [Candidatus Lambdaproteobacteria bacterium]|nr:DMT family transporter [Candidatus Lambdaproteobacteria bacterium]